MIFFSKGKFGLSSKKNWSSSIQCVYCSQCVQSEEKLIRPIIIGGSYVLYAEPEPAVLYTCSKELHINRSVSEREFNTKIG